MVQLVDWYRRRWLVKFFPDLESRLPVEALQLGTLERLERALVIYPGHRLAHPALGDLGPGLPELAV